MSSTQLLTRSTLVLRHNYRPIAFWPKPELLRSAKSVAEDIYQGIMEPLIMGPNPIILHSPSTEIAIPLVARLNKNVSDALPSNRQKKRYLRQNKDKNKEYGVCFNLDNLMIRDLGCCAYCKESVQRKYPHAENAATFDHILPKSRGGKAHWLNAALSCQGCNNYKADRTPEEAGMDLFIQPWRPTEGEMLKLYLERETLEQDIWYDYLNMPDTPRTDATLTALA